MSETFSLPGPICLLAASITVGTFSWQGCGSGESGEERDAEHSFSTAAASRDDAGLWSELTGS